MFSYFNHQIIKILLSIIFFILIVLIINNELVGKIIWWSPELFGDLKTPIKWLECHNVGIDHYNNKAAFTECSKREFNYGKIFFKVPYSERLSFFYINILPFLLIFIAIYFIFKIFTFQSYISTIFLTLVILNPSSFLLFSSANIDLLIFVLLIFTALNRIYLINWLIYFFLTFVKLYPIILFLNIFFENNKRSIKKIAILFITLIILSLSYLYINFSEYIYLLNNLSGAKAGYHYLFSLNSIAKILKYKFELNYVFLLFFTYSIFFYLSIRSYKKLTLNLNKIFHQNISIYDLEFKLFIISAYLSVICFICFSNFFHREIFLIGTLPLIFKFDNLIKTFPFRFIIILYFVKLLYSYIYGYYNVNDGIIYNNDQRIFSNLFLIIITIKSLIDYMLMIIISALTLYCTKIFYNHFKLKLL